MTGSLRPGEVASSAGVNLQTLRYYERRGLLARPDRTLGGHRVYGEDTVTILRVIKAAQRLGFTLAEVRELLAVGAHAHPRVGRSVRKGVPDLIAAKLVEIEQRINDLSIIREALQQAQLAGCDDMMAGACAPACPIPFERLAT